MKKQTNKTISKQFISTPLVGATIADVKRGLKSAGLYGVFKMVFVKGGALIYESIEDALKDGHNVGRVLEVRAEP